MMAIAVSPMAMPISPRRKSALAIAIRTGEPGCSSSAPNAHAEIMKAVGEPRVKDLLVAISGVLKMREAA